MVDLIAAHSLQPVVPVSVSVTAGAAAGATAGAGRSPAAGGRRGGRFVEVAEDQLELF
jgi:hypothetical protein